MEAASSGQGRGSTFTVRLPSCSPGQRVISTEGLLVQSDSVEAGFKCPEAIRGVGILLVDDEPDTLKMLRFVLTQCGAEVQVSESAAEALNVLRRWKPALMISDIAMPEQDGYALIEKVRSQAGDCGLIPAIALTAYARVEDRTRVLSSGFQMYLRKPVEPSELLSAVVSLLVQGH